MALSGPAADPASSPRDAETGFIERTPPRLLLGAACWLVVALAVRHTWRPLPVMATTAGFWLMLHLFDGPTKLLYLLPAAVLLSVARHRCDSVRASLALHLLNNLVFLGISLLALAHGP